MQIYKSPAELYQLLRDVTYHIVSWARPGMKMSELDTEARRMLGEYSQYFTHSLGHGVGIQIHESPSISAQSSDILEPGMVITIEPGIYGIPIHNPQSTVQNNETYGLRYEEMIFVDKEKLRVL